MQKTIPFYPTLGQSWVLTAFFLGASLVVSGIVAIIQLVTGTPSTGSLVTLIAYILPFFFLWLFITVRSLIPPGPQAPFAAMVFPPKGRPLTWGLFAWLLFFTPLLPILVEPLTNWIPMPEFMQNAFANMFRRDFVSFVMVAVAAPVCEEWLCRGIIARGLLRHTTPAKAILWSAFIFALIHLNPWQAVPAFVIGLFLGYVYWKTRSLLPCIFIHFVNNGFSFFLLYLFPDMDVNASTQDIVGDKYWLLYIMAAVTAGYIGYIIKKRL
ncbi:MAG: CPBP family intramembrane metalloprotease [Prevotellaceae bacterium]|jgi:membrane protease YdiL (CAAX protease family)|nr:CPBP family intramembrane metalloprotease [Prevotellaceae bacterium]